MKIDFETIVIFVSFITSFFAVFLSNGIIIGVPAIAQEFVMNNVIQNWIPTIFFLVVAVFTVPAGQISGKFGVKKSLLAGIIVYLIGSIGAVLSFSTESFMIFRIVQGAGVAFLNVSAMAMVVQAVKPQNRGKALGFTVTGVYLATSLSPVICGFLVQNLGWRSMFYFVIPFLVLCIILMMVKIPQEWKTYEGQPIDKLGSILWAIGILTFIYGFTSLVNTQGVILTVHIIQCGCSMQLSCNYGGYNNLELSFPVCARLECSDVRFDIDNHSCHNGNHGSECRKAV